MHMNHISCREGLAPWDRDGWVCEYKKKVITAMLDSLPLKLQQRRLSAKIQDEKVSVDLACPRVSHTQ